MTRRRAVVWRLLLLLAVMASLSACLVFVSTGPTSVAGATIIFVARTEDGGLVAALHISVIDADGWWRDEGATAADGAFRCRIEPGVRRVRAGVTLPDGYTIAESDRWPREIDVPDHGNLEVQIRVKASGHS